MTQNTTMEYHRRVNLAMNYISQNLAKELTLEEIANAASFSMFHFHRIFKAVVGETVADFTRRLRLESAANRLIGGKMAITRIAVECGFSSSQNLAKAFKQYYDMSPSEYRKSKGGNTAGKNVNAFSDRLAYDTNDDVQYFTPTKWASGMTVVVKELPDTKVAFLRKMGAYCKETARAFGELMNWAGPRGYLRPEMTLGILYWDNPEVTRPENCRVDAFISLPQGAILDGQIGEQTISGGTYAVCHFEVQADGFQQAWDDAFRWLVGSGFEGDDRPCYERYLNNGNDPLQGKWIFEICIPLKS